MSSQPMAAAATAAVPGNGQAGRPTGGDGGAEDLTFHVLAVCRTPEDQQRLAEVAQQIVTDAASAGAAAPLAFHIHTGTPPASLPTNAAPSLDVAAVSQRLSSYGSHTVGRLLLAAALLGSTQDVLRNHGSALGDGAVVVADRQTGGKGRGGNQWTSPAGCLMFSALRRLRVQSPAQAPLINYLVCLAVTRGVARALKDSGLPPLPLRIKWPNDIYVDGVKIGGALINTTWQGGCFNVVVGIGLNVNNRTPTTCLDELLERTLLTAAAGSGAASGAASGPPSISREAVLAGILASLEEVYDIFEQRGFGPLEPEYLATWLHSGQVLDFDDSVNPSPAAPPLAARLTVRGLSPGGFLLAEDATGARFELTPDGNSLDMMRGLIRRKVN